MSKYKLLTPEGTGDLLFDETVARRTVESKLHGLFSSTGYSEVITPGIEFFDVFDGKNRYMQSENMYRLTDTKGRLIVIRPDSTMPIARLAATRLRFEELPLRLCYNQNIFRLNPKNSKRDDEIVQSGLELIGGENDRSDFEVVSIALETLKIIDNEDWYFEIGHSEFFRIITQKLGLDDDLTEEIRGFVKSKNHPELVKILSHIDVKDESYNNLIKSLIELPQLFGDRYVFDKARKIFKDEDLISHLDSLEEFYDKICSFSDENRITVDFGLVNRVEYYTGIIFKGYVEGYGKAVLDGGRYDKLVGEFGREAGAIGFAVNINAAALTLMKKSDRTLLRCPDVIIFSEDGLITKAFEHAKRLTSSGLTVIFAHTNNLAEMERYGRAKGIHRIDIISEKMVTTKQLEKDN